MIIVKPNIDRFNQELNTLQQGLTSWEQELSIREAQLERDKKEIKRQREELIGKSNLIVEQVNGLRKQKEQIEQKTLEAVKLKKLAEDQLEKAENIRAGNT